MPVQDNDDKRVPDQPVIDAEEELRRKQAQAQEQQNENSVQKSGKLLPFLNAKAEHHQSRIDSLDEKIANQTDKIDRNKAKIEALSAKADKLEDTNRMLSATLGGIPLVQSMIRKNEERITAIREEKIPKREQKIERGWKKIDALSAKRDTVSHKLDRVVALSDAIKSFSIGFNKHRREAFSDAMDRLNEATYNCLSDKKKALTAKKDSIVEKYNSPETNTVDKYKLQQQINDLNDRIEAIDERIEKVWQPDEFYSMQDNDTLDAQMKLTSDRLGDMAQDGNVTMSGLAEDTLFYALETEELDKSRVAALADKFNFMASAEEQLEDDYNMIDGVINNGSKADLEKTRADLTESIEAAQAVADNPHMRTEMREMAVQDIARLQGELKAVENALLYFEPEMEAPKFIKQVNEERTYEEEVSEVQDWLLDMVADGKAEIAEDGAFKVNSDYYKELPRNDRHVESMTEAQAVAVMSALTAAGVEFSAASRGDDKVGITVSKKDLVALNDIMYSTIGKIAKTEAAKENAGKGEKGKYQTINPEYYASLSKEQRHSRVEAKDVAREIVKGLMAEKIPYSAVVRKNDTVAITVSKDNAQAYKKIESAVKGERAAEYINPEFYKALPKEFRVTLPMTEEQAKAKIAELDKKGIAHSAVLNGDKSAVTVSKKDQGRAFFSRSQLKKEVQRISGQGKKQPQKQKTPKKKDTQGLD
ncbi:MAG: DUF4316 domain-containing protein [Ruminococcus sp.]|nr:DUF4316 domain-containing protein [Ruminococcus sp.]MBR1753066.1 DUF4316 domain-containing protein [Ruminococcus sp.]